MVSSDRKVHKQNISKQSDNEHQSIIKQVQRYHTHSCNTVHKYINLIILFVEIAAQIIQRCNHRMEQDRI